MNDLDLATFADIARRINLVRPGERLTPKAARMRFVRAMRKFRAALEAEGIDEVWFESYMHTRTQDTSNETVLNPTLLPEAEFTHDESDDIVQRPGSLHRVR